jgi:hypothetical protein
MNRLGFFLLTFGATLASLGWIYNHHVITLLGLIPIVALSGLAALFPSSIAYDVAEASRPKGAGERRLWILYALVAVLIVGLGVFHLSVQKPGEPPAGFFIMVAGAALLSSIYAYNMADEERVRALRSIPRRRG